MDINVKKLKSNQGIQVTGKTYFIVYFTKTYLKTKTRLQI